MSGVSLCLTVTQGDITGLFVLSALLSMATWRGQCKVALSSGGDHGDINIWKEAFDSPEQMHSSQGQGCELSDLRDVHDQGQQSRGQAGPKD